HRIVKASGEVGGFAKGTKKKAAMLKKEGIKFFNKKVVGFEKVLFKF
ncbi:MGMT family protein, partial [Candidatus Woesearchaeota archaeon]|nr:MGMT family protein [Candidatus Woesearchaeota archaeon]